jgi:antirestriction protein ArdC
MSNFVQNKLNSIVQGFIDELEKGTVPWIKPYEGGDVMSLPKNRYSRRRYKGLNALILWDAMNRNGWSEPYFITYKQCQMFDGAHVKAGEKGTTVIYWGPKDGDDEQVDIDTGEVKPTFIRRCYTVFNIEQCKGLDAPPRSSYKKAINPKDKNPMVDEFVRNTGARISIRFECTPAYHIKHDYIQMPKVDEFVSGEEWAGTILHELNHWAMGEKRLNVPQGESFGDRQYCYAELVAEIGSAFLCSHLHVPLEKIQHAEYLGEWISVLKENPSVLWSAASTAERAYAYLTELALKKETEKQVVNQ